MRRVLIISRDIVSPLRIHARAMLLITGSQLVILHRIPASLLFIDENGVRACVRARVRAPHTGAQ